MNRTEALAKLKAEGHENVCGPDGCNEDDLEPESGGWWRCGKCGYHITYDIARAFIDYPLCTVKRAHKLVHDGTIVIQTASLVAGVPVRVYSSGEYVDFAGNKLDVPVLQFEEGHAFVIPEKWDEFDSLFVQLTPEVAKVFSNAIEQLRAFCIGAAIAMKQAGAEERTGMALVQMVVKQQLRAFGS